MSTDVADAINARIDPDSMYPLAAAERILNWGRGATRQARRNGLRVLYSGRCAYVKGSDVIEYIERTGRTDR